MHRFASALGSLVLATFASAPALADCIPGTGLCASAGATIGIPQVQVGGQVTIGLPPLFGPPPAAPQALPQEAPPPVQVYPYQPQPVYVYGPQAPRPQYGYAPQQSPWSASRLGLDLRVDGAAGFGGDKLHNAYGMGGAGLGLRYRATPHFGIEAGVDVLAGKDYNDAKRVEVAGTLGGLLYLNPRSRAQLYLAGGLLVDHARSTLSTTSSTTTVETTFTPLPQTFNHVGGYAGLGLEMFATRHLAFHLDARGIVRQAVGNDTPEFTEASSGRTTNTSGGLVGSAGMIFYF
jgi:hypothetical protein